MKTGHSKWLDRLRFYTRDLTKEQAVVIARYCYFKKCEVELKEYEQIKTLIEKQ